MLDVLKWKMEDAQKAASKLDISIDVSFDKNKRSFILCNKDGSIEFNVDDCYNMLTLLNHMFNMTVNGIDTDNEKDVFFVGRLGRQ